MHMHEPGALFRTKIKESRDDYFVEYQPADSRFDLANLTLTFFNQQPAPARAAELLELESRGWFQRFPAPLFASAYSDGEDLIDLTAVRGSSHFTCQKDPATGETLEAWYNRDGRPVPPEQMTAAYQNEVYAGLPAKLASDVRGKGLKEHRAVVRTARTIVLLIIVVPMCIELISLGVPWVDWILTVGSVTAGLIKLAKARGWIKPSARQVEKEKDELLMRHHHYHCKKNPEAFARLKAENFERETRERVQAEAADLLRQAGSKKV